MLFYPGVLLEISLLTDSVMFTEAGHLWLIYVLRFFFLIVGGQQESVHPGHSGGYV